MTPIGENILDFQRVDLDAVAEVLNISTDAVNNGSQEIPPAGATQLDGPQLEIRSAIQGMIRQLLAGYKRRLDGLTNEIRSYNIQPTIERIYTAPDRLDQSLTDLEDELGPAVEAAQRETETTDAELKIFQSKYGITRGPDYPNSYWLQWGILLGAGVLEALMNAYFFHQGLEQGIVAGALVALVLAMVDMMVVFVLGRIVVWMPCGTSPLYRLTGATALVGFLGWASLYNLLATHVRENLQSNLEMRVALERALDSFLANPIHIEQADSIFLLVSGIAFSVAGLYSGISWDDWIPGYGKKHRKALVDREEVKYQEDSYREHAIALRNDTIEEMNDLMLKCSDNVVVLENLIQTKETLLEVVRQCISHHRESCEALIQRYRDHNQRARSTPPPDYFDDPIEIEIINAPDYDTSGDHSLLVEQKGLLSAAQGKLQSIEASIRSIYRKRVDSTLAGTSDVAGDGCDEADSIIESAS